MVIDEEYGVLPIAVIMQDGPIVPLSIYDVDQWEMYYGASICIIDFANDETLEAWRSVGYGKFIFPDGFLADNPLKYSQALEEHTYFYWGDYIVYHHPTPGVGGPYPHLVFMHLPTGLTINFQFSGDSVADAFSYYSSIVHDIQIL